MYSIMGYNNSMNARKVKFTKKAKKDLRIIPKQVIKKVKAWVLIVEQEGIREARKTPGFHDEPLRGKRSGQRSVRLNKAYRLIYTEQENSVEFLQVEEINKHEY